jgi:hypothetical protein
MGRDYPSPVAKSGSSSSEIFELLGTERGE